MTILHFPYDEYHLPTDVPALVDEQLLEDAVALGARARRVAGDRPRDGHVTV